MTQLDHSRVDVRVNQAMIWAMSRSVRPANEIAKITSTAIPSVIIIDGNVSQISDGLTDSQRDVVRRLQDIIADNNETARIWIESGIIRPIGVPDVTA